MGVLLFLSLPPGPHACVPFGSLSTWLARLVVTRYNSVKLISSSPLLLPSTQVLRIFERPLLGSARCVKRHPMTAAPLPRSIYSVTMIGSFSFAQAPPRARTFSLPTVLMLHCQCLIESHGSPTWTSVRPHACLWRHGNGHPLISCFASLTPPKMRHSIHSIQSFWVWIRVTTIWVSVGSCCRQYCSRAVPAKVGCV